MKSGVSDKNFKWEEILNYKETDGSFHWWIWATECREHKWYFGNF